MTASGDPESIRVGTAEREAAIATLGEHWRAGRLDPAEHEARTTKAFAAVTRADLDALFTDLPYGPPESSRPAALPTPAAASGSGSVASAAPNGGSGSSLVPPDSFLGRRRDLVMALMPFVCLVLFFTGVRTWLVWLLIPVAAIVLYGAGGKGGRDPRGK